MFKKSLAKGILSVFIIGTVFSSVPNVGNNLNNSQNV